MRVSCLLVVCMLVVGVYSEEPTEWMRAVDAHLATLVASAFTEHFTPKNMTERVLPKDRLEMQVKRLRARVGIRLSESLEEYEIICPFEHIGHKAFETVEQELRAHRWSAFWLPRETHPKCGGFRGYMFVHLTK